MIYFVPAWWKTNEWVEDDRPWYNERSRTETDDTVKQVQLFHRNNICDYLLVVLNYAPNLRHFLHRQSIFRAKYWSLFDSIQCIASTKPNMVSYRSLNWPEDAEFVYSMFAVIVMVKGKKYAQIDFGEYGNMTQISFFDKDKIVEINNYDDRGFVSSTISYEKGRKLQKFYDEAGTWKICIVNDGEVLINPKANFYVISGVFYTFNELRYSDMDALITEVFFSFIYNTQPSDIFCAAASNEHSNVINYLLRERKLIYSVFGGRLCSEDDLKDAKCIIADSEENYKLLIENKNLKKNYIVDLTPYDTRVDRNISNRLRVQNILIPVDLLKWEKLYEIVANIAPYLVKNDNARIHFYTRSSDIKIKNEILEYVGKVLKANGYPEEWATSRFEDEVKFSVDRCINEIQTNKCLKEQRLFLDLAEEPDLFLQISCISLGIPQILSISNKYMKNYFNGRVNRSIKRLDKDVSYYLENLANWNVAMVNSYKLGKEFSKDVLVEKWKGVIRRVGRN